MEMINIRKHASKIMGIKKYLRFLIKLIFSLIAQCICLPLHPICWVTNIRFVQFNCGGIGHLAGEFDCYIKEGILGLRPSYKTVIVINRKNVVNLHLLSYWKKYFFLVEGRFFVFLLSSLCRNKFTGYDVEKYVSCWINRAFVYPEIQKKYYGRPPVLSLTNFDHKRGWIELQKLGVPKNAWFVCVHCREKGYALHRDEASSVRNVNINNYFMAMQEIVDRGGWVVRIGDPTMKLIPMMKNVIDYAHLDIKSDWMDVFLSASCKFFLGSNSGMALLPNVFGVRSIVANMAGPFSVILHYGPEDISIPKLLWSVKEKRYLSFKEILSSSLSNIFSDDQFMANGIQAIENSPEDIKEVTVEMLDALEGKFKYSEEDECLQAQFKSLMNPTNYSYGARSRVGKDFLRKYEHLL